MATYSWTKVILKPFSTIPTRPLGNLPPPPEGVKMVPYLEDILIYTLKNRTEEVDANYKQYVNTITKFLEKHTSPTSSDDTSQPLITPPPRISMSDNTLQIVKLTKEGIIPTKGSEYAAGHDLYSAHDYEISPHDKILAYTDLQIKLPPGTYGRIAPRSSLAWQQHIAIGAGVLDRDFRGNVAIVMFNLSENKIQVKAGDKIAQLICEKIVYPQIEVLHTLDCTTRGDGSFGSSGRR